MYALNAFELCIKNVFFWDTFCSCSSKNGGRGGYQLLQFLLNRPPHHSFIFCDTLTLCISKEHIFHVIFIFFKSIHSFTIKFWKKVNFLNRYILHWWLLNFMVIFYRFFYPANKSNIFTFDKSKNNLFSKDMPGFENPDSNCLT